MFNHASRHSNFCCLPTEKTRGNSINGTAFAMYPVSKVQHGVFMRSNVSWLVEGAVSLDELAQFSLFGGADIDALTSMLAHCPVRTLRRSHALLVPGLVNQNLYLLLQGRLCVQLDAKGGLVSYIEVGEMVGETSLIEETPNPVHVTATEISRVLVINHDTFWMLLNASHPIAYNMLRMLVDRMHVNNTPVTDGMRQR